MAQGVPGLSVPAPTVGLLEPSLEKGATDLSILVHRISKLFFQHGVQEERWPSGKRMVGRNGFPVLTETPSIHFLFRDNRLFYSLFLFSQALSW